MSLFNAILELVESLPTERVEFPDELVEVAKARKFLPAALDSGGGFGIRPSGEIVSYTWDDLANSITLEADPRIRNVVFFAAAQHFPLTIAGACGVLTGAILIIISLIPISYPFPHIPCHI